MEASLLESEGLIRLGCFTVVLAAMLGWEFAFPLHPRREPRFFHNARNLAVLLLDALVVRLIVPLAPVGLAQIVIARHWGLMNQFQIPGWLAIPLTVVLLDLAIYGQHVVFHALPVLWRMHMVHHSDLEFSATTGVRFHPLEILISAGLKLGLVILLGPPVLGVMLFEILLNGSSLFNHTNVHLPVSIDRWLRWIIVTPDMHRVHHSAEKPETNSNFGFNLPWWDRLFRTYRAQPRAGHEDMIIGLEHWREKNQLTLGKLLLLPFSGSGGGYSIIGGRGKK
ncbi:MAG: sterol desaturase family protein [Acidobacteria bacterium]|nr:sterol desaturase family protein [Acidobacteriota bacterium]